MLSILHSGQTGVERGAHRAALTLGLPITGFKTPTERDELGRLPDDVAACLQRCPDAGPRAAARATLATATGLLVLAPEARTVARTPTIGWLPRAARVHGVRTLVADTSTLPADVIAWLHAGERPHRLYITGPRVTRWPPGETLAKRLVMSIAMELDLA